jgi:hypothetical protein
MPSAISAGTFDFGGLVKGRVDLEQRARTGPRALSPRQHVTVHTLHERVETARMDRRDDRTPGHVLLAVRGLEPNRPASVDQHLADLSSREDLGAVMLEATDERSARAPPSPTGRPSQ